VLCVVPQKYSDFLESVFRCYKAKNSSRYFWMEHWMTLLETLELVGDRTSIGTTQAKLVFLWSKVRCGLLRLQCYFDTLL
jgi:hypothetical protein